MKYKQRIDGEGWAEKSRVPFRISCCNCKLVHEIVIVAGRKGTPVGIAVKVNHRATAAKRRVASEPLLPSGEIISGARDESQSNEQNLDTSERA